jgi:putative tricarboxylic transport membrane protein
MNSNHLQRTRASIALPEALIALGLLLFAGLVLWQTLAIPVSPMTAQVGPKVLPYITAAGLALLAVLLLVQAVRGGWQQPDEKEVAVDWKAVAFVTTGLIANVALIGSLGFSAASTIMFVLVAYGFGSRRPVRDAGIGLVLALTAYFGFAKALGVNIGAGVIENLLGG